MSEEILYVSEKDLVAFTKDGVHSFFLEGGVPAAVPEEFVAILTVEGARPVIGKAAKPLKPAAGGVTSSNASTEA